LETLHSKPDDVRMVFFFMLFVKMVEKNTHFANRGSPFISTTMQTKKKSKLLCREILCLGFFACLVIIGWSLNLMLKDFGGDLAYGNSRMNTSNWSVTKALKIHIPN
jgi:hypothetical protein